MAAEDYSFLSSVSAHPDRPGDTSNFDPTFAANVAAAIREAQAAGLKVGLESGYRTPGQTGSSFDASGRSLHSYGLATDISGLGGPNSQAAQQWAAIAARHNLYNPYGIGNASEFNHWQAVPNELTQADVPAYQRAFALRQGAPTTAVATAQPAPANAPTSSATTAFTRSNPFVYALGNIESNWRNVPSTVDKDYPGQPGSKSQGLLQIDTPTWQQYAKQAGVTAPNAMAASEADQIKVASLIPIGRFGGITQDKLHKQFGDFDKSATVGELATKFGGAPATTAVASNAPTTPAAAPAAAQPAAAAPQPSQYQNFTTAAQKGDVGGMLGALGSGTDEKGNTTTGLIGDMAKQYAKSQEQNPLQTPAIPQPQPVMQNAAAAQQLMGQILAQSAKPLGWSSRPYGAGMAGPQAPPGMSLTSTSYPETYPYGASYG